MATKITKNGSKQTKEDPGSVESNIVRLAMSGKLARVTKRAIAGGVAKGLPVTFKRGQKIITRYADGREEVLRIMPRSDFKVPKGVRVIAKQ
ncbi:MAG TPA: hypothetical protein VFE47_27285 [Tepidisphaeraceae bacterium]|jgi:hypothetical protein|nr:hypothetical protein [Tepidisphaeraceae bacterium]